MRRFIIGLTAALALVFVGAARADDTKKEDTKSTTQKTETKEASPSTTQDTGMGGSGTATKTEKKTTTEKKDTKTDDAAKTAPPAK